MNIVRRDKIVIALEITMSKNISGIINMRGKQIYSRIEAFVNCQYHVDDIDIRKLIHEARLTNSKGMKGKIRN